MDREQLEVALRRYNWFHRIEVAPGVYTPSRLGRSLRLWDLILSEMDKLDLADKRVLDVGCRDGLFSFAAEKRGAAEIVGIDNDLSLGATELLIPLLDSRVQMHQMNMLDLSPDSFGRFDVILFFGVLYHLRYPFTALRLLAECLTDDGVLFIESGMLADKRLEAVELLYCPVENSPYEPSSCTFFNEKALATTMQSFDCRLENAVALKPGNPGRRYYLRRLTKRLFARLKPLSSLPPQTTRQLLRFRKQEGSFRRAPGLEGLPGYWNATHTAHRNATYGKVPAES